MMMMDDDDQVEEEEERYISEDEKYFMLLSFLCSNNVVYTAKSVPMMNSTVVWISSFGPVHIVCNKGLSLNVKKRVLKCYIV